MFFKKGQTIFQNIVIFIFIVVGIMIVSVLAVATTPFIAVQVASNNITGGMGFVATYFNLILVTILLIIGLVYVSSGGVQN